MKLQVKRASFSTDNSRTSRLSIFYSISNHKNFIPKFLDNVLADFAQTRYSVYSSLRLRANRRKNSQLCCANNVGICWLKSLTGFKLCATTSNNMQQGVQTDATCNIQGNVGSCRPTMLRPFARGLTHTANNQTALCNVTTYYRSLCCLVLIEGCKPVKVEERSY